MKILYHHRIASRDGQATHVEEMIRALRDLGHDVHECAPDLYRQDTGEGGSPGWVGTLKSVLPLAAYELAESSYSLVAYRRLREAIRTFRPDAIYERFAMFNMAGVWAARRYCVPLLLEVNSPIAFERGRAGKLALAALARRSEQHVWRSADRVLPVTEVLAAIVEGAGVSRSRIRVIGNGIDPRNCEGLPSQDHVKRELGLEGRVVVGFTGFVCEWDRLDRILTWLAGYAGQERVHLLVVGDGPVRGSLEAHAQRLGIADRLTFTGVVPRDRVPGLAVAFDVALQTALVPYASPLCLFEYLALGKAIAAPDQPNHHEVLRAGVDALLYRPDDPGHLERTLETLVGDPGLRKRLGSAAMATIAARGFTWRANAERVVEEIRALSAGGVRHSG